MFTAETTLPVDCQTAFAWHARPGALPRLIPPWEPIRIVQSAGSIQDGARVVLQVRPAGVPVVELVAEHDRYEPPYLFRDRLVRSPFAKWEHLHRFQEHGNDQCRLIDQIDYELPLGAIGQLADAAVVSKKLAAMFAYRHQTTRDDLAFHQRHSAQPRTILVTGASGLVGDVLCPLLSTGGHTVRKLTRSQPDEPNEYQWDPRQGTLDEAALDGVDAVIHLAGESIIGRWTDAKKRRILDSRVETTRLLARRIAAMNSKPALVTASGINFYQDGSDRDRQQDREPRTEASPSGDDFLSEVCRQWEGAADPAREAGARVAHVRLGMVLSPEGGALAKMLPAFRMGLGGPVGDGRQVWSWVARDDAASIFAWAALSNEVSGPVNATAAESMTSRQFGKTLADVLGRPAVLPVPAFAARLALGEVADELLLASLDVRGDRTRQLGYQFRFDALEPALRHMLGKT